jgi:hypothetical protein
LRLCIRRLVPVNLREFVAYWRPTGRSALGQLYDRNIGKPLTAPRLEELFTWKNQRRLSARKAKSVRDNFVARIAEARRLPPGTRPEAFLRRFDRGGAIWRVFFLHCWNPRYPIYDQNVHRAMAFALGMANREIPRGNREKIRSYLECYLPFWRSLRYTDQRELDRALLRFGSFLRREGQADQASRQRPNPPVNPTGRFAARGLRAR